MYSAKQIRRWEADNARSAAAILKDPARFGAGLTDWARQFQRDQRAGQSAREAEQLGQRRFSFQGGRS